MKTCLTCQATLNDKAKFCKECGSKVNETDRGNNEVESTGIDQSSISQEAGNAYTSVASKQEKTITIDADLLKSHATDYWQYLKQSLLHPYSLFKSTSWINGLISLVIFALIQMILINDDYIYSLFYFVIFQAITVGLLMIINRGVLNRSGTIYEVLTEYGGLMNTQSILFILAGIIGIYETVGAFIMFIALLNQFNIYNYYLFNNQIKGKSKIDGYYQILIAYIALSILAYYIFKMFLNF